MMNQIKPCAAPTRCKLQPSPYPLTGCLLLSLLLLGSGPGCSAPGSDELTPTMPGSTWLAPTTLAVWGNPYVATYSISNANKSHAAIAWGTFAELSSSLWKSIGAHELLGTSWSRIAPLPFADLSIVSDPKIVIDDQDALTMVVGKFLPGTPSTPFEHQVTTRTRGTWSTPGSLNGPFNDSSPTALSHYPFAPEVATDDQGRGLLAWVQNAGSMQLWVARFDHVIGTPIVLRTITGAAPTGIHVVANHDGTGFVAWDEMDSYYLSQFSSAGWSVAKPLAIPKVQSFGSYVTLLSVDGSQAYFVVYSDADKKVRAYHWSGDHLSPAEELGAMVHQGTPGPSGEPTLCASIAADGTILTAWATTDRTIVTRRLVDGLWAAPVSRTGTLGDARVLSKARAAILFSDGTPTQAAFIQEMAGGSWLPRQQLATGIAFRNPQLGATAQGDWLAAWETQTNAGLQHGFSLNATLGVHW